jgi:DNA polymerase-3 subunit gamma/tau
MSYEPLHHKYRPKTFAELVGQEAIATTLSNAINSLKIAPAYLFTGPRGTGKTSSARILAKSLNCVNSDKPTPHPCGKCNVCQEISKGTTLDVIEIDAASNTGVDNIREIIDRAQFAPVQCRYKVYVIDECHMLSTQAFNALLKTLEEPPLHVVFVLATTDPQRVLATIISRCQRFDFRRIPIDAMVQHLSKIAETENIQITQEAIAIVAQVSQGGLRDAESLLDQLGLLSGEVTPEEVWRLVGSVSEQDLLDLLIAIVEDNSEALIDCTREILDRGREPLIVLQNLASFYRDLLIAKTAPLRNDLVACTQGMWKALIDIARNLEITMILQGQQHLRTAEVQIKNTTQPRLWLEVTLLGLLPSAAITQAPTISYKHSYKQNLPKTPPSPAKTIDRTTTAAPSTQQTPPTVSPSPAPISGLPSHPPASTNTDSKHQNGTTTQNLTSQPVASTEPNPSPPPQTPPQNNLNELWQQVLTNLIPVSRRELLRQMCHVAEFNGSVARVAVKEKWYDKVKEEKSKIKTAFQVTFKADIEVNLEIANSNSAAATVKAQQNVTPAEKTPPQAPQPLPSTTPAEKTQPQAPQPLPSPTPAEKTQPPSSTPAVQPAAVQPAAVSNTAPPKQTTPALAQPTPIAEDPEASEVMKAAKRLAQALDGEIIQLNEENTEISDEPLDSSELEEVEEEDVEF